jgi:lipoprotein-anchoring transpeptidase ErfK/SrfK
LPAAGTPGSTPSAESAVPAASPEPTVHTPPPYSVEIDLTDQRAYLLKNGRKFVTSPISSGRYGHLTPTGDFTVLEKDLNHKSSLYGTIVDRSGRTVIAGADSGMSIPHGWSSSTKPGPRPI